MGILQEFEAKQNEAARLQKQLESFTNDPSYRREKEFLSSLESLMSEFQKTPEAVLALLGTRPYPPLKKSRQNKAPMKFRNPHTGEVIEAKTKANRQLKAWISKHGADIANTWRIG